MFANREYQVTQDDDGCEVALIENGVQVGGAIFPADYCGNPECLAHEIGRLFQNNANAPVLH